jgi:hypothetical protein
MRISPECIEAVSRGAVGLEDFDDDRNGAERKTGNLNTSHISAAPPSKVQRNSQFLTRQIRSAIPNNLISVRPADIRSSMSTSDVVKFPRGRLWVYVTV